MSIVRKTLVINTVLDRVRYNETKEEAQFNFSPTLAGSNKDKVTILALEKAIVPNLSATFPWYENALYLHLPSSTNVTKYKLDTKRVFRNGTELASYLTTLTAPLISWTFDTTTFRLSYKNISGTIGYWFEPWYELDNDNPNYNDNTLQRLGFMNDDGSLGLNQVVTASDPIRLQRTACYYLKIGNIKVSDDYRTVDTTYSSPNIMAMIPANEFGKYSVIKLDPAPRIAFNVNQINSLDISFLDDQYYPIDTGGQPAILEFSYFFDS